MGRRKCKEKVHLQSFVSLSMKRPTLTGRYKYSEDLKELLWGRAGGGWEETLGISVANRTWS